MEMDGLLDAVVWDLVFLPLAPGIERFKLLGFESEFDDDWSARLLRRFFDNFFLGVGVSRLVLSICCGREDLSVIVVRSKSCQLFTFAYICCSASGASGTT